MGLDPEGKIECTIVDLDKKDEKALNIALNSRHISGEFDEQLLEDLLSEIKDYNLFDDLNFGDLVSEFDLFGAEKIKKYTQKINLPIYEPSGPCPKINDLYESGKTTELIDQIDAAEVPDDIKAFLKIAATRHTVFDYGQIAEYYSHADKEIQELMEASALVIIDFKQAIEGGFVELSEKIDILRGVEENG